LQFALKTFQSLNPYYYMDKPKRIRIKKAAKVALPALNDGMNTPVPDSTSTHVPSESEAALNKQADNPLGDPNKI